MDVLETSRNFACKPGYEFRDSLDLPGWDEQSVWGYDGGVGSFFAQLWRNGSRAPDPEVWLSGARRTYPWPGCLALDILEVTQLDPLTITNGLAIADPNPHLRPVAEIGLEVQLLGPISARDVYGDGRRNALAWVLGQYSVCPGSNWGWNLLPPTPQQVVAEYNLVNGRVYRLDENPTYASGADEALHWVLSRG